MVLTRGVRDRRRRVLSWPWSRRSECEGPSVLQLHPLVAEDDELCEESVLLERDSEERDEAD